MKNPIAAQTLQAGWLHDVEERVRQTAALASLFSGAALITAIDVAKRWIWNQGGSRVMHSIGGVL